MKEIRNRIAFMWAWRQGQLAFDEEAFERIHCDLMTKWQRCAVTIVALRESIVSDLIPKSPPKVYAIPTIVALLS